MSERESFTVLRNQIVIMESLRSLPTSNPSTRRDLTERIEKTRSFLADPPSPYAKGGVVDNTPPPFTGVGGALSMLPRKHGGKLSNLIAQSRLTPEQLAKFEAGLPKPAGERTTVGYGNEPPKRKSAWGSIKAWRLRMQKLRPATAGFDHKRRTFR